MALAQVRVSSREWASAPSRAAFFASSSARAQRSIPSRMVALPAACPAPYRSSAISSRLLILPLFWVLSTVTRPTSRVLATCVPPSAC
jgi:hypothetical protein